MKPPKKLILLKSNSSGGLCSQLLKTIEDEVKERDVPVSNLIEALSHPFSSQDLARAISEANPRMLLLITPAQAHNHVSSLIHTALEKEPGIQIILVSGDFGDDEISDLARSGITDFIVRSVKSTNSLRRRTEDCSSFDEVEQSARKCKEELILARMIGESPAFVSQISKIPTIAKFDVSVLISGETGTGKELVARAIHYLSPREAKPFIPVNCGAIPLDLVENELFGHKQGAFTNAVSSERGIIQEADGGTIFFDEIDSLPLPAQVKLLRFLQEKEFRPLGSTKTCKSDVRIIAATSSDLRQAIATGKFRHDLYYRLNVVAVDLPPLRERQADIPLLACHFLAKYAAQFNRKVDGIAADALKMLLLYEWPGNVRELEHVMARAVILLEGGTIEQKSISLPGSDGVAQREGLQEAKHKLIAQFEKSYIQALLLNFQGNVTRAAKAACKDRRSFSQLVRKYNIDVKSFRRRERAIT